MAIDKRLSSKGATTYRARLRATGRGDISKTFTRLTHARDWELATRLALKGGAPFRRDSQDHTLHHACDRYLELPPTLGLKDERNRRRHVSWWRAEAAMSPGKTSTPVSVPVRQRRPAGEGRLFR